ncbi:Deoxyribodipyrimidine photo-lyase [Pseudidiomarina piscicola]|uniref:Deoxyribodipyrimidine photo-lyase n=1 Tax=Pseudidiomarina piscicola TaxID=2614830 RepID=A0A6S6WLI2_9GAMM|nr:deoxyribodipyrimidine photo-lyase [Pseudidiomarina piscicola]CAB0150105.1 Deoxyribodipyrimidine photo-lyase [Pseudidiomarina piscicola]VZT39545.1 Deoxyribodipyrimidine photo-lyase [Pseudomonas aeruginosa]
MASLIWFRNDLRLRDNPAVAAALSATANDEPIYALYLYSEEQWRRHHWAPIKVDLLWRHLEQLQQEAAEWGIQLHVKRVQNWQTVPRVVRDFCGEFNISEVMFNCEYPLDEQRRDRATRSWLAEQGIGVQDFHGLVLVPPVLRTQAGDYYKKFTPYFRSWLEHLRVSGVPAPYGKPERQPVTPPELPASIAYERSDSSAWKVGEEACYQQLDQFIDATVADYNSDRDRPAIAGTSKLSPYWELGILAPQAAARRLQRGVPEFPDGLNEGAKTWLSELAWREFYQHLMDAVPRLSYGKAFQQHTEAFPWRSSENDFKAWCEGRTGFPIVDAGMRQLKNEGWMHNRVRMIVANFLVKDLHIDWRKGERYFMEHLIDGSFPANNGGWQWSASTGTDAVPYFRVFNPTSQSKKVDPDGTYIRSYVKELADCPTSAIHEPQAWLKQNSVDYPEPIVNHKQAREEFLRKFKAL